MLQLDFDWLIVSVFPSILEPPQPRLKLMLNRIFVVSIYYLKSVKSTWFSVNNFDVALHIYNYMSQLKAPWKFCFSIWLHVHFPTCSNNWIWVSNNCDLWNIIIYQSMSNALSSSSWIHIFSHSDLRANEIAMA